MTEKVFVDAQKIATFKCSECEKSWKKDLSNVKGHDNFIRLKCNCPCGNSFSVSLDKRRHSRKDTNLGGAFIHNINKYRGLIEIKNISKSGIGFELSADHSIRKGDRLELRFNLDDSEESYVCKEVIIRKVKGKYVGVEFVDITQEHENIDAYFTK